MLFVWQKAWGLVQKQTDYHSNLIINSQSPMGWSDEGKYSLFIQAFVPQERNPEVMAIRAYSGAEGTSESSSPLERVWNIKKSSLGRGGRRLWVYNLCGKASRCLQRNTTISFQKSLSAQVATKNPVSLGASALCPETSEAWKSS